MGNVAVIGAGLTGPTAALTLARAGHHVTVFERRPEDDLFSTGILGITEANWTALTNADVDLTAGELGRAYRDYGVGETTSPFRRIIWTDLHNAISQAARDNAVQFRYETEAPEKLTGYDAVINAGGIIQAAHRGLSNHYAGQIIYRGISTLDTDEGFTTYKLPDRAGFLDLGHTRQGAAWAMGVKRPKPDHLATTFTTAPPVETINLPREFQRIVYATRRMMVLPQSIWSVADGMHNPEWTRFTLGDANGPVRPITTSGANLAIYGGMRVTGLLNGSEDLAASLLRRREYAIRLGLTLRGPEIGGCLEDPQFPANQAALYGEDDLS